MAPPTPIQAGRPAILFSSQPALAPVATEPTKPPVKAAAPSIVPIPLNNLPSPLIPNISWKNLGASFINIKIPIIMNIVAKNDVNTLVLVCKIEKSSLLLVNKIIK